MRKLYALFAAAFLLLILAMPVFSQEITVRFTGQLNGTNYCRLDSVAVTNIIRGWTETVEYPDTIIVLGGTVGTDLNIAAAQGLSQNIPNPFDCETRVELSVSQREDVRMQLLDVAGKIYAEYSSSLDAGMHIFDISAANPQTYLLNAMVGNRQYSIRMINVASGCNCSIKYAGNSGGIEAKLTTANEFQNGDNMRYVGYTTIYDDIVTSAVVEQLQNASQDVTLNFTHYSRPIVVTLAATDITITSARLNGNITENNASVTARGFQLGVSENDLSVSLPVNTTDATFSMNIPGLDANTTYYFRAYATDEFGTLYGEVMSFATSSVVTPTVSTHAITDVTYSTAILAGSIISDGGVAVSECGFRYSTSPMFDSYETVTCTSVSNSFGYSLDGLNAGTTYYVKAYATNSVGTSYGDVMQFTTSLPIVPTVQTLSATSITYEGATLNGNISSDGGATVIERGFMYGTSESSMTQIVRSGSGIGNFTGAITGLTYSTTYYYKAYATNSIGTACGEVLQFTTTTECNCGGSYKVADIDGNQYATVLIGEQCWMAENLKTTKFADGTSIPVDSSTTSTTAYRYNPNNSSSNVSTYGYLYNWPAAMHGASSSSTNPSNVQGVCPTGWHLPSDAEWTQLTDYVSSQSEYQCNDSTTYIAKALASTIGWNSSAITCAVGNTPSNNNSTGFGALPAGYYNGSYSNFGNNAYFWSATEYASFFAYGRGLSCIGVYVSRNYIGKGHGRSVRCVRDN